MLTARRFLAVAGLVVAVGCQSRVRKDQMVMGPVILPNGMCAQHGTVSMSKDKDGERMLCELQEQIGTHLPRCVCWDEGYTERELQLAWDMFRGLSSLGVCGNAGGSQDQAGACVLGQIGGR